MLYIGIDWAHQDHQAFVTDDDSSKLASFAFANTVEGFDLLNSKILDLGATADQCLVAMETASGLLVGYLLEQGYTLYPINPKAVDRYRDRFSSSGAKSDPLDAMVLAHILRTDRWVHNPLTPSSELAQELLVMTRDHHHLGQQRTRLLNQITDCLKLYYPAATSFFTALDQPVSIAFLKAYPTPHAAQQLSINQLESFCFERSFRNRKDIKALYEKIIAPPPTAAPLVVRAKSRYLLSLLAQLEVLQEAIASYEDHISSLLNQHPDRDIFLSLPRTGMITAARMLAEIGDNRDNFPTLASLQGEAGTAPVTRRSGQRSAVVFRRACRKRLRDVLQQFARQTIINDGWAKAYYRCQKDRGHSFSRAVRALANRWLAIIWRLWNQRSTYDESYHQRSIDRRRSKILANSVV